MRPEVHVGAVGRVAAVELELVGEAGALSKVTLTPVPSRRAFAASAMACMRFSSLSCQIVSSTGSADSTGASDSGASETGAGLSAAGSSVVLQAASSVISSRALSSMAKSFFIFHPPF